jgi:hypothetical protein
MTNKPTVADFFAQYAEKGHIFPEPYLRVALRGGISTKIGAILPSYCFQYTPIFDADDGSFKWSIDGKDGHDASDGHHASYDIVAVLDDAGDVIAGEVV